MPREVRVGLLIVAAVSILALGIFILGEQGNLFASKDRYYLRFKSVSGLAVGNPVKLNGVTVGSVEEIFLPEDIKVELLTVWIAVDQRYNERLRSDSRARIKTLGLLGDKYIEISSGSIDYARIETGGEIAVAPATDVEQLIASGEDVVANTTAISASLRTILGRMEAGEGILGELTMDSDAGQRAKDSLVRTLETIDDVSGRLKRGEGTLGKLLNDPETANHISSAVARLDGVLTDVEEGEGALSLLLSDSEAREKIATTFDNLESLSTDLSAVANELRAGDGALPRLIHDEPYGEELLSELHSLVSNLNALTGRLEEGEGTVGQLLNDPEIYQALDDILLGINESKMLRWLVRGRQKKGIKKRFEDAGGVPSDLDSTPASEATEVDAEAVGQP